MYLYFRKHKLESRLIHFHRCETNGIAEQVVRRVTEKQHQFWCNPASQTVAGAMQLNGIAIYEVFQIIWPTDEHLCEKRFNAAFDGPIIQFGS